jgi:ankyrin repeat protein
MLDRGVDQADLDYALDLTMSSSSAREHGQQLPLVRALLAAGAIPTRGAIVTAAAHHELDPLRALVGGGLPMSAPLAAALGANDELRQLLREASGDDVQTAFALAVINHHAEAARLALDAGADVDAFLPVHTHSTALHQAALDDDVALVELLLARGASTGLRDTLWGATPLGWAIFNGATAARAILERREAIPAPEARRRARTARTT